MMKKLNKTFPLTLVLLFSAFLFLVLSPHRVEASPDSITYDPDFNVIKVLGYSQNSPANFSLLYDADLNGTLQLLANTTVAPDSETLRPNGAGDYQEWETLVDTSHWQATSDENDSTYIETVGSSSKRDIQNLTNPSISSVASVEVFVRVYGSGSGAKEKFYIMEKLGANERLTSKTVATRDVWADYSTGSLTTNPAGENWTIQNVTDLQVGVQVQTLGNGETLRCSEIWIVVTGQAFTTSLDRQVRPADSGSLKLNLIITGFVSSGTVTLNGKDVMDNAQTEDVSITGNGTFVTQKAWKSIDDNGISATGKYGLEITQPRWGVVWKHEKQYSFDCSIKVGKIVYFPIPEFIEGHLAGEGINILFSASAPSPHIDLQYGSLRFGKLIDASSKISELGVNVITDRLAAEIIKSTGFGNVYLYSSLFLATQRAYSSWLDLPTNFEMFSCILDNVYIKVSASGVFPNVYRLTQQSGQYGLFIGTSTGTWNDILSHSITYGLYMFSSFGATIKNYVLKNNTYLGYLVGFSSELFLINPDVENWAAYWYGTATGEVYRQYEFDLKITYSDGSPITNASVVIRHYGQGGGVDYQGQTNSSGQIPTQTLTMGFYNQTGGGTIYDYNPYNITIVKNGYQTYTKNFTLNEKIDWTIALQPEVSGGLSQGFIFGGILALMIMLVLGLAYFGKKS